MNKLALYLFAVSVLILSSCSDDDDATSSETGNIILEFDARVGTQNLLLGTTTYKNALDQDFTVDVLRYYISNIKLTKNDGTVYEDPLSEDGSKGYYLVDDSDAESTFITLTGVPAGQYTAAEFTIGVDATRVSQGAQTGALDPANNLFWSWNSGYIFVQFEGTSPQSTEEGNSIMFHTGGYKVDAANANSANNIKVKSITFGGEEASISKTAEPEIHIIVDVKKFFEGTTTIDFSETAQCHAPSCGVPIANNYINTFVFDHMHQ